MAEWDDWAAGWDENPAVRLYADKAFAALTARQPVDGLRVLDFGCGTGTLTEKLADRAAHVVAVDLSPKMIARLTAKGLSRVTAVTADLTAATAPEPAGLGAPFDLITASSVCAFLPDYAAALGRMRRLLAPGAIFVQWDWELAPGDAGTGFSKPAVEQALREAGFDAIEVTTAFSMAMDDADTPVLMAIARNNTRDGR